MRIDYEEFGCNLQLDGEIDAVLHDARGVWPGIGFSDVMLGAHGRVTMQQQGIQFGLSLAPASQSFAWKDEIYHFSEDNIVVLEPGSVVRGSWAGSFRNLTLKLAPETVERLSETPIGKSMVRTQFRPSESGIAVGHLLQAVSADLAAGSPNGSILVESISATLLQICSTPETETRRAGPTLRSSQAAILRDFIACHLTEPLTLNQLAEAVDTSVGHLVRAFKASFGMTPYQYILRERVTLAEDLLAHSNLCLGEIALRAGFSDPSQMSKTFRRQTGRTPREAAREARAGSISGKD